jgi:hypothetical protein
MNKFVNVVAGIALGLFLPAAGLAKAQPREIQTHEVKQAKEPKTISSAVQEVTVAGVVTAKKNNRGKLKTVNVAGDDGTTYSIEPRGGELIAAESGKRVEVTGWVEEKKGEKWLSVSHFKVATAAGP